MSTDEDFRDSLASRLASIGERVETSMGGPQDIEGVIQNDKIYLVQTRPQLALGKRLEVKG
jgi:phosphoenolpyruvate synthase/pyruvate phosphate dikinase